MAELGIESGVSLRIRVQKCLEITAQKVHTRDVSGVRFDTLGDLIRRGKRVDWALDILIQGCEVNDKPEFSALLRHKARRSAKLRLFIGIHLPYNPLQLQLIYHSPSLGFDIQRDRLGFEAIKGQVTGPIGESLIEIRMSQARK